MNPHPTKLTNLNLNSPYLQVLGALRSSSYLCQKQTKPDIAYEMEKSRGLGQVHGGKPGQTAMVGGPNSSTIPDLTQ